MTEPAATVTPAPDPFPEGSVEAGVYVSERAALERAAVVLAMALPCWIVSTEDGRHHLRIEPAARRAVGEQLACYDRESVGWPPRRLIGPAPVARARPPLSPLVWVLGIFSVFEAQLRWPGLADAALLDSERVFARHEWWRAATALWLHADLGHLAANAASGLLVFAAVVTTLGRRAGWGLIAAAAVMGNLAAVTIHHADTYRSLGASTAVFAGLGLLTGRAARVFGRADRTRRLRAMLTPLAAGLAVLGLFGAGEVNVDVIAHFTGFAAGLPLGFAAAGASDEPRGEARV